MCVRVCLRSSLSLSLSLYLSMSKRAVSLSSLSLPLIYVYISLRERRGSPPLLPSDDSTRNKREQRPPKNGVDTLNYFSSLQRTFVSLFSQNFALAREEQKNTIKRIKGGTEREREREKERDFRESFFCARESGRTVS